MWREKVIEDHLIVLLKSLTFNVKFSVYDRIIKCMKRERERYKRWKYFERSNVEKGKCHCRSNR